MIEQIHNIGAEQADMTQVIVMAIILLGTFGIFLILSFYKR